MKKFVLFTVFFLSSCCSDADIPAAKDRLYSSSAKDRNDAALQLARCGSKAASAVPRLGQLIYDENVGVQSSAAYALRKIDTAASRTILEEATARKRNKN